MRIDQSRELVTVILLHQTTPKTKDVRERQPEQIDGALVELLAPLFDRATPLIDHTDLELTIRGLLSIYRRNRTDAAS